MGDGNLDCNDDGLVDVQCESCEEWLSFEPSAYGVELEFSCPFCSATNTVVVNEE